ncbi:MAG: hypothetical protein M0R70_12785 [Nitrospirae bacterium]|nr:hypothetical protein [Nitrospirota bacterium]
MMGIQSKKEKGLCDRWNKLHPIGTAVVVKKDEGHKLFTITRSEAWQLGSGTAVILVEGISGGYKLTRVSAQREAA